MILSAEWPTVQRLHDAHYRVTNSLAALGRGDVELARHELRKARVLLEIVIAECGGAR